MTATDSTSSGAARPLTPLPLDASDMTPEEVAARFRWAQRAGTPHYLWPDVPVPAWRMALTEIGHATVRVLAGTPATLEASAGDARTVGIAAMTAGMGPLLAYWVESGRLRVTPALAQVLALHRAHERTRWARAKTELRQVAEKLAGAGIPLVALKGAHTGPAYFPGDGTRPLADLDIMVAPEDGRGAVEALRRGGYRPRRPFDHPHHSEWIPPGADAVIRSLDVPHAGNPLCVELHTSLVRRFDGVRDVRLETTVADGAPWPDAGPGVRVLRQPHLIAFLALHASEILRYLQLFRLVELVLVSTQDTATGQLDWDDVLDVLERARAVRFAFPAFQLAARIAPQAVPAEVLNRLRGAASPRLRRVVDGVDPFNARTVDVLSLDSFFVWAEGPWESARRALDLVWPPSNGTPIGGVLDVYGSRINRVLRLLSARRPPATTP